MPESAKDCGILRELARQVAEVAALPVHQETIRLWKRLNGLEKVRPLVWINEICWDEMGPEMNLECADAFCRSLEWNLRATLYQWRHLPGDMVVEGVLYSPVVVQDTGFGLGVHAKRPEGDVFGSADFEPILKNESDLEKIKDPVVAVDGEASERNYRRTAELVGDILRVQKCGLPYSWWAPWDVLCQYYGITEMMIDMYERPAFVHKAIGRMTDAMLALLDQWERLGVLALNNTNVRVGAGGLGYTDELPQPDFDGRRVRPIDMWGSATPQIFSEVSPAMHEEFALQYELKFLERYGLNCYGCCEPLHRKVDRLKKVPRLRRISMSPKANVAEGAAAIGDRYIFSHKPNPAVLAWDHWDGDQARAELRSALEKTRGCTVEIIMKDITTVRGDPRRLWEWSRIAMEEAERAGERPP